MARRKNVLDADDGNAVRAHYLMKRTKGTEYAEDLRNRLTFRLVELPSGEIIRAMLKPPGEIKERTMLIRLAPIREVRMMPFSRIQLVVGRRFRTGSDAEKRAKSVERVEPSVEPKDEFVEVRLEVLRPDAVVGAAEPRLQVREDEVHDRPETSSENREGTSGTEGRSFVVMSELTF